MKLFSVRFRWLLTFKSQILTLYEQNCIIKSNFSSKRTSIIDPYPFIKFSNSQRNIRNTYLSTIISFELLFLFHLRQSITSKRCIYSLISRCKQYNSLRGQTTIIGFVKILPAQSCPSLSLLHSLVVVLSSLTKRKSLLCNVFSKAFSRSSSLGFLGKRAPAFLFPWVLSKDTTE